MSESERHAAAVAAADRIDDEVANADRLVDYVAAAMRAADGDHTMGTGRLAEVAVAAIRRFENVQSERVAVVPRSHTCTRCGLVYSLASASCDHEWVESPTGWCLNADVLCHAATLPPLPGVEPDSF